MDGALEIVLTLGDATCDFWEKMRDQRLMTQTQQVSAWVGTERLCKTGLV